ncbi:AHH domain-containing protein, partial [Rhizobium leguminosarum]|uniref:AHH domain-containing protein n=1 Tax=Rhizobium leguminosarum TaxID=384 RepID=UPI001C95AE4B
MIREDLRSDWDIHHLIPQSVFDKYPDLFNRLSMGKNAAANLLNLPNTEGLANLFGRSPHTGGHLKTYMQPLRDISRNLNSAIAKGAPEALTKAVSEAFGELQSELRAGLARQNLYTNYSWSLDATKKGAKLAANAVNKEFFSNSTAYKRLQELAAGAADAAIAGGESVAAKTSWGSLGKYALYGLGLPLEFALAYFDADEANAGEAEWLRENPLFERTKPNSSQLTPPMSTTPVPSPARISATDPLTPIAAPSPLTSVAPLTPASLSDFRNFWDASSSGEGGRYSSESGRGGSADISADIYGGYGGSSWGGGSYGGGGSSGGGGGG